MGRRDRREDLTHQRVFFVSFVSFVVQAFDSLRMKRIAIAMRMLRRNWSAGELRVLLLALVIAVASVTTVGFFADRVQSALDRPREPFRAWSPRRGA